MSKMTKRGTSGLLRLLRWWPLLLGPAAVAAAVGLGAFDWEFHFYRPGVTGEDMDDYALLPVVWNYANLPVALEGIAHWLLVVPMVVYWVRAIFTRNPLYVILAGLAASLLCREIHFTGMDKAIYVLGVLILVWLAAWRDLMVEPLKDRRHARWLVATVVAYLFAVLADRRVFKFIPGEADIHSQIEECAETMAHLVFLVASLVGRWRRYRWPAAGSGYSREG